MAAPPASNPPPPLEPPSLPVQDELFQEIFLPTTVMAPRIWQIPPPAPSIADIPDVLLEHIFLRLPAAVDLARASTACPSFHGVIAGHTFLRRYRAIHPPPLIGMLHNHKPFVPAQPPHPSAVAARAFVGFDFSCSSFLPSTPGHTWSPVDFFEGRVLLAGAPDKEGGRFLLRDEVCDSDYRVFFVRDLAVCDLVHRRYILLPAVPGDVKALVLGLETFLAPGEDEGDPLSFRVLCLAQCMMHLLLLVFSSLDGQWHALTFDRWSARATLASFANSLDGPALLNRQFVYGCFCWHLCFLNELLLLDARTMQFSDVDLLSEQRGNNNFVIVEAAKGMLGMLTKCTSYDEDSVDDRHWLMYSIMRNNQWHSEKIIRLPVKHPILVGVAGGYLLIEAFYASSPQEKPKFECFSVDVKTFQVKLFATLSKPFFPDQLYAGFPPSLCAPI